MINGLNGRPGPSTTVDRVVDDLRRAMFEGRLNPGTPLREEMVAQQLGVSRSSVREAFRVLTQDGFLRREPNRSVVVRHLTVAEVEDIFRARQLLEGACVREAATCPDQALADLGHALEVYAKAVRRHDHPRTALAHIEFHASMVEILSGSRWLAEVERSLLTHMLLILATVHTKAEHLHSEIELHRELVDLCRARKVDEALACLNKGLEVFLAFAIRYTFEAFEISKSPGAAWTADPGRPPVSI